MGEIEDFKKLIGELLDEDCEVEGVIHTPTSVHLFKAKKKKNAIFN